MPFGGSLCFLVLVGSGGATFGAELLAGGFRSDDVGVGGSAALVRAFVRGLGGAGLRARERRGSGGRRVTGRDRARLGLGNVGRRRGDVLLGRITLVLRKRRLGGLRSEARFALGGLAGGGVAGLGLLAGAVGFLLRRE